MYLFFFSPGFYHEHQRMDRDEHIDIYYNRIRQSKYDQWEKDLLGVHPPLRTLLTFDFVLQDTKMIFWQCYQNYLKRICLKFFIFQMG